MGTFILNGKQTTVQSSTVTVLYLKSFKSTNKKKLSK